MSAANLRALRLHYAASNLPGAIPFTTFAARRDAEHVAAQITADETDGWRYKVAARPSGFVVEVYEADNRYLGAL